VSKADGEWAGFKAVVLALEFEVPVCALISTH
jgi:hypothetical protein